MYNQGMRKILWDYPQWGVEESIKDDEFLLEEFEHESQRDKIIYSKTILAKEFNGSRRISNNIEHKFDSISEASTKIGVNIAAISMCCHGQNGVKSGISKSTGKR